MDSWVFKISAVGYFVLVKNLAHRFQQTLSASTRIFSESVKSRLAIHLLNPHDFRAVQVGVNLPSTGLV